MHWQSMAFSFFQWRDRSKDNSDPAVQKFLQCLHGRQEKILQCLHGRQECILRFIPLAFPCCSGIADGLQAWGWQLAAVRLPPGPGRESDVVHRLNKPQMQRPGHTGRKALAQKKIIRLAFPLEWLALEWLGFGIYWLKMLLFWWRRQWRNWVPLWSLRCIKMMSMHWLGLEAGRQC